MEPLSQLKREGAVSCGGRLRAGSFGCRLEGKHAVPEKTLVSFVVIAYNEAENIACTLTAITALEDLGEHEIVIVDDGSRDGTTGRVADIAAQNPRVRLISLPENCGRGYARNTGVAVARGGLIAMVDADITLPPDWLARTREALSDYDAVGGIAVPDGDVSYLYRRYRLVPRVVRGTTTVTGSNGLYRRDIFNVVSFDQGLRDGEDIALNHAIDREGLSTATVPGLIVHHQENKSFGTSLRWLFDTGRGATRQLLTYHQMRQPDIVTGAFFGSAALGLFAAVCEHRIIGMAVPVAFILVTSVLHVRSRFEIPWWHWPRIAPAIAVDSALLTAYFAGRLSGLTALWRRR